MKKNNLIQFEKDLLKSINFMNGTRYNYTNLMEWSSSKEVVEAKLQEGEIIYETFGCYIAIKPTEKKTRHKKKN
jgi:hypothetical protein